MPDALSARKGEFSRPSFSATEAIISGKRGTKRNATENPRAPVPTRVSAKLGLRPNIKEEGPISIREMLHKMKAMHVTYLRWTFVHRTPTRGEPNAYVKQPIANRYPTLSSGNLYYYSMYGVKMGS